ncbi:MAG: UPF0149 family protein [Betaproteobacteria bacterium]|nr:UPF0149 family protein [Betaproteobacteria bacterium]
MNNTAIEIAPDMMTPLTDADWDALDNILASPPINGNVLSLEAMDGLIAAGVCGPRGISTMEVIELMFEDEGFPEFEDPEAFERFLSLVMRRWNEYARMLAVPGDQLKEEDWVEPYIYTADPEDVAEAKAWKVPARIRDDSMRPGDWDGRGWASGFMLCVQSFREEWFALGEVDPECMTLLGPALMMEAGFNPENPRAKFEPEKWFGEVLGVMPAFAGMYRALDGAADRAPVTRAEPKVGRNDPCPCGSGKKFKKCCGATFGDGT